MPAKRWKTYRRRRAAGQSCYELVLEDAVIEVFLEHAGLLMPGVEHDKQVVLAALAEWIEAQVHA